MKIYIIEDEVSTLELYQRILGKEGYALDAAVDGQEGFEKLQKMQELPDLILLDLLMPRMNGFEFMEARNKIDKLKDIPIIIVTNLSIPEKQMEARRLGAVEYIIKTAEEPHDLVEKIKKVLQKKIA